MSIEYMNHEEFINLVRQPDKLKPEQIAELREITELYPSFVQARILYVKALQQSKSIHFETNLKLVSLYSNNRRSLYYFFNPEKKLSNEPYQRIRSGKSHGDYFDMIENIEREGGDARQSLKNLAQRLKSARAMVVNAAVQVKNKPEKPENKVVIESDINDLEQKEVEITEIAAKNLIRERKYIEAIEILKRLNLNNPKKSVYFADQIRFLEKVIVNLKN
jgi:hypothetical protein